MLQTTDHHRKGTAMLSYEDAFAALSRMDTETEAERVEREAAEAGNDWGGIPDSELTRRMDEVAVARGDCPEDQYLAWDARQENLY